MSLDDFLRARSDRCSACGYDPEAQGCRCEGGEWSLFVTALRAAARADGAIHQDDVRPLIRGHINPKHIGTAYRRAKSEGLIEQIGKEPSTDTAGRNTHHDSPVYRLRRAA